MKINSPLVQMTLAMVALTGVLIMLADMFLGVLPDRGGPQLATRQAITEMVAVNAALQLQTGDMAAVQASLRAAARQNQDLRSLAVRKLDGSIVAQSGLHAHTWHAPSAAQPAPAEQLSVALRSAGQRWGHLEAVFQADTRNVVQRWLDEPLVRLVLFMSVLGALVYGLYMRRALQHLDPASVIPDRVQRAFDAMAEGVVVLDARARVLLANRAVAALHRDAGSLRTGQAFSEAPWLAAALPPDAAQHPWARAMALGSNTADTAIEVGLDTDEPRQLVVNCAPITDTGGGVRGCLVTLSDQSALHRANTALRGALDELQASRDEVQRKNEELSRLATRDPLSGCLNRRAFYERAEPLFAHAQATGTPLGCLLLDIDHFKSVNDTHGHGVGDRVIQELANTLQANARDIDLVCRYGGEEFCLLVPGLDAGGMLVLGERLRGCIENDCGAAVHEVPGMRVTASLGLQMLHAGSTGVTDLLNQADQALYRAKRGGRNRVEAFTPAA